MPAQIYNAAPMTILEGIDDSSTTAPVIVPEELPTHLPYVQLFTKKGPTEPQIVVGDAMVRMFGDESFDESSKYATHGTVLANILSKRANSFMLKRLKPSDAPKPAAMRLSLDLLGPITVPAYARNTDGSYKRDATTGALVEQGTVPNGYKAKWVVEAIGLDEDGNDLFGQGSEKAGDQTDQTSSTQSRRIPILDFEVSSFGSDGNNQSVRISAPTVKSATPIDGRILSQNKVYPYRLSFAQRADVMSNSKVVPTIAGSQYVDFCFVPNTIFKAANQQLFAGVAILKPYQDISNPNGNPDTYGPFGRLAVYQTQINALVAELYAAEEPLADEFSDFTGAAGEQHLFNFVSGVSSQGVPYHTYLMLSTDANAVRLTENTNIYALGGGDGTMGDEAYDLAVRAEMDNWIDANHPFQDMAKYPVSFIYDTGFTVDTKKVLPKFIGSRKDTFVVLGTHDVLGPQLSADQESSLAIALKAAIQLYPESEVYGTGAVRGMIIGRSGTLIGSNYPHKLPLTLEIADKCAQYMGAGNGVWKSTKNFDRGATNQVTLFSDINVTFTPATTRQKDWSNGLNWVQSSSRRGYFFPALKTVADDDTSILNSFFNTVICCDLQKIGEGSWRAFTGTSSLTDGQLTSGVNDYITDEVQRKGSYANRVVVQPNAHITSADKQRGYSWTTQIKVFGPNMKTIAQLSVQANRIGDLQAQ